MLSNRQTMRTVQLSANATHISRGINIISLSKLIETRFLQAGEEVCTLAPVFAFWIAWTCLDYAELHTCTSPFIVSMLNAVRFESRLAVVDSIYILFSLCLLHFVNDVVRFFFALFLLFLCAAAAAAVSLIIRKYYFCNTLTSKVFFGNGEKRAKKKNQNYQNCSSDGNWIEFGAECEHWTCYSVSFNPLTYIYYRFFFGALVAIFTWIHDGLIWIFR